MTCKAVYASLGLSIYITKDELSILLRNTTIEGSAYIGKDRISVGGVRIILSEQVREQLTRAYTEDNEAIRLAKASMSSGYLKRWEGKKIP